MSILDVESLYKTYGDKVLFDHISFAISEKERIGLIGVNGTGKSTLLNVLAGREGSEGGTIRHAKAFHAEYLPQAPAFEPDVTAIDYIYKGTSPIMAALRDYERALADLEADPANQDKQSKLLDKQQAMDRAGAWEAEAAAKNVLSQLGIREFRAAAGTLSGGQKKRIALARALIQPADLLILDEPTNHLDNETIEWLEGHLAQYPGALLLVTHDRYFLNRVTTRIFELARGRLYAYDGNFEAFLEKKAEREEKERTDEDKRQNRLRRELAWMRRGAKARSTKQKARIERVLKMQEQKAPEAKREVAIEVGSARLGKKVLEVRRLTKALAGRTLINQFDYLVTPQERLGIIGANGSGKTTLLNLMARRLEPDAGSVEIGETVRIGYYTQENIDMDENLRMIDYIKEQAQVITAPDGRKITAEQMLERFLFPRSTQYTYIRRLSGGERKRLYLLRILMAEPNVLFLDEPTNDLDIETLAILEDYLDQFPGVVITVSHDRYFLDRVIDRLIAFEGGGVIRKFEGSYSEYLAEKAKSREVKLGAEQVRRAAEPEKKQRKKLTYKEQLEWNGLEERIAGLEERVGELKQAIVQAGSDAEKVQSLFLEQQEAEQALDLAMERWTELSLIIEASEQE